MTYVLGVWWFQVDVHSIWNQEQETHAVTFTGTWCLWCCPNFPHVVLFSIRDRGGGDVYCYNPPILISRLQSNNEIDPELLCIWYSRGGGLLSWVFWVQWYYWLRLQRRSYLFGGGNLDVAISFPPVFVSLSPSLKLLWKVPQVLLRKQRTWKI